MKNKFTVLCMGRGVYVMGPPMVTEDGILKKPCKRYTNTPQGMAAAMRMAGKLNRKEAGK